MHIRRSGCCKVAKILEGASVRPMEASGPDPNEAQAKIAAAADAMIANKVSFIEGSRTIASLLHAAGFDCLDEPWLSFVSIASQTDVVPVGKVRQLWSADAQLRHASEWRRAEAFAKAELEVECHKALKVLAGSRC
jgi:alcohol dehydrogenase YqhD (iron-dependent ADH family)